MDRQENRPDTAGTQNDAAHSSRENDPIEERLLEGREESQQSIEAAAEEAFVEDQRENPDHPTRIRRQFEVEDPSHSQGI